MCVRAHSYSCWSLLRTRSLVLRFCRRRVGRGRSYTAATAPTPIIPQANSPTLTSRHTPPPIPPHTHIHKHTHPSSHLCHCCLTECGCLIRRIHGRLPGRCCCPHLVTDGLGCVCVGGGVREWGGATGGEGARCLGVCWNTARVLVTQRAGEGGGATLPRHLTQRNLHSPPHPTPTPTPTSPKSPPPHPLTFI